jgi:hypothetical protein
MGENEMEDKQAIYPVFVRTTEDQRRWRACLHAAAFTYGLEIQNDIDVLQMTARSVFKGDIPTGDMLRLGIPQPYSDLRPATWGQYDVLDDAVYRILAFMPGADVHPSGDVVQIYWHDLEGSIMIVFVTPEAFELRFPILSWDSDNRMQNSSRLWKRAKHSRLSNPAIGRLIDEALLARQAEYVPCRFCGELVMPEYVLKQDHNICCRCASNELGVAI